MTWNGYIDIREAVERIMCMYRLSASEAEHAVCEACASGLVRTNHGLTYDLPYPHLPMDWRGAVIEQDHKLLRSPTGDYDLPQVSWADLERWLDRRNPLPARDTTAAGAGAPDESDAAISAAVSIEEWIFARHVRRLTWKKLYAEARAEAREGKLGGFTKSSLTAAFQRVYDTKGDGLTKKGAPPASGWPLQTEYQCRWAATQKVSE